MKNWLMCVALAWLATVSANLCHGTDLYFRDLEATSPSGRYRLTAKSPGNATPSSRQTPFQQDFVYLFRDTKAGKDLWTRKQPEDKPTVIQDEEGKPDVYRNWKENPPVGLYVQDDGWSVLWLAGDELAAIRRDGKETGRVDILSDALSNEERKHYVHYTTAGLMWGRERSYFTTQEGRSYFVVRTWWGHRVEHGPWYWGITILSEVGDRRVFQPWEVTCSHKATG